MIYFLVIKKSLFFISELVIRRRSFFHVFCIIGEPIMMYTFTYSILVVVVVWCCSIEILLSYTLFQRVVGCDNPLSGVEPYRSSFNLSCLVNSVEPHFKEVYKPVAEGWEVFNNNGVLALIAVKPFIDAFDVVITISNGFSGHSRLSLTCFSINKPNFFFSDVPWRFLKSFKHLNALHSSF